MQICTLSNTYICIHMCKFVLSPTLGQFAVSCLRGGRDGIVFYQDPDIGATATGSLAEYLYLLDEDKKNKEVVEEVEEIEE